MDLEDQVIITMTCSKCDNIGCEIGPKYVPIDSLVGCTRRVPEKIGDLYLHYTEEIIPFWLLHNEEYVNKSYKEIFDFLQNLYKNYPIIHKLDKKGKVIGK